MPRNYVDDIRMQKRGDLIAMLDRLETGRRLRGWPRGRDIEHIVLRAFDLEADATVVWPYTVQMSGRVIEQIDGAVYVGSISCLVETKDYGDPLNIEPIAKLRNQLSRRPAGTIGVIFSTSGFSDAARFLTRSVSPLNVLLWEYAEFRQAIDRGSMCDALMRKYRFAVEHGMPDYSTIEVTL
jgi:hypothetical protein